MHYRSNKAGLLVKRGVRLTSEQPLGKSITEIPIQRSDGQLSCVLLTSSGVLLVLLVHGPHLEYAVILPFCFSFLHPMERLYKVQ